MFLSKYWSEIIRCTNVVKAERRNTTGYIKGIFKVSFSFFTLFINIVNVKRFRIFYYNFIIILLLLLLFQYFIIFIFILIF